MSDIRFYYPARIQIRSGSRGGKSLLMAAMLASVVMAGCVGNNGTVGQTIRQDANGSMSTNGPPITLSVTSPTGAIADAAGQPVLNSKGDVTVPEEKSQLTATGPTGYSVSTIDETRWLAANQVMRSIFMRSDGAGKWTMNSSTGTDVRVTADEINFNPNTGELIGKGFKFETLASDPFKASNESLAQLKEWFQSLTEAQKAVFITQMQAQADTIKESMPTVANAILKVVEFVTAK